MPTDFIDVPIIDKFNAFGGAAIAIATYIFGEHWVVFFAYLVLNLLDYITGVMKSRILRTESSSVGIMGIVKKFGHWVMIVISFGLAPVLNEIGETIGMDVSAFTPFFGWFTLGALVLNELRSILENLVESGHDVPTALVKGLKVLEKVMAKQDQIFGEEEEIDKETDKKAKINNGSPGPEQGQPSVNKERKNTVVLKIKTSKDDE